MRISRSIADLRVRLAGAPRPVGFVPTMGALHEGHEDLFRRAREECSTVVGSIFVNPLQFGPGEDFERYPRDLDGDARRLDPLGVDLLFAPDAAAIYPPGFSTRIAIGPLADVYEGAIRPGHFAGVCTVVCKLFHIVEPQRAYFGRKDAQQLAILEKLVRDLDLPIEVRAVATVRDPDGLAKSSRNAYLSAEERARALGISRGLFRAAEAWARGERAPARLEAVARDPALDYDYLAAVDPRDFAGPRIGERILLIAAARVGRTRLLDNIPLGPEASGGPEPVP